MLDEERQGGLAVCRGGLYAAAGTLVTLVLVGCAGKCAWVL